MGINNINGHIMPSRYGNLIFLMKRQQELLNQKREQDRHGESHSPSKVVAATFHRNYLLFSELKV